FTGQGGEVKWARQEVMIKSNTPFKILASAEYPAHTETGAVLDNGWFGRPQTFYSYLLPIGNYGIPGVIIPNRNPVQLIGRCSNGTRKYVLASKVKMPQEFWRVQSGRYLGSITLTVQAR
ncbi:MAG: hypothetical protein ACQERJ_05600, partial [Bacillota bacterium]